MLSPGYLPYSTIDEGGYFRLEDVDLHALEDLKYLILVAGGLYQRRRGVAKQPRRRCDYRLRSEVW